MAFSSIRASTSVSAGVLLDRDRGHLPGFDFFRFVAASAVVFTHSFGVAEDRAGDEPLKQLTHVLDFGILAVFTFFFISGFVVTQSYQNSASPGSYLLKRGARIMPGLILVTAVCALVVGPLVTSYSWRAYFLNSKFYQFLLNCVLIFRGQLPGVFQGLPSGDHVNVSLWTIRYEVSCYLCLLVLSIKGRKAGLPIGILAIVLAILSQSDMVRLASDVIGSVGSPIHIDWLYERGIGVVPFFFVGSLYYLARYRVVVHPAIMIIAGVVVVASVYSSMLYPLFPFALGYLVMCGGFWNSPRFQFFAINDYSYGIYLFGFPIQQSVMAFVPGGMTWWQNFLVSYPIVVCLAALSWHWVERPCLLFARGLDRAKRDRLSRRIIIESEA